VTEADLAAIEAGVKRWHSVSAELTAKLIAEIRRLQQELEKCSCRS
jgi:hypothetical protein